MSSQATVVAAQDADFKPIDVKELPGAVAMSVEKYYPEAEIKEAAVKEDESGTKTYRVVLRQQEGTEMTVLFSAEGVVLPDEAPAAEPEPGCIARRLSDGLNSSPTGGRIPTHRSDDAAVSIPRKLRRHCVPAPPDKKRRPEKEEIAAGCISERFFSYFCRKDTRGVPFRLRETAEIIPYELDAVNTAERTCS